ncbi:TPA: QacE family quaternary ammonium compound efflux SMR transporter [Staphylococcus aureus]|uniref:DMT family transporter n=2 Tax=Staphylococcus aureus TaxID=1280 RepID=UPI000DEFD038|nr:multidrug efflux SMR transporter [Staphylococcus aureus]HDJ6535811.1 QacE family quaternary ammonium compound efflux SMR transporter [Staphylococcus aureus]
MGYIYLIGAIISEVFGSSMLKLTATIKSKLPMIGIIVGYLISFYLLSLALISIPLSFSYAVWSGLGTALTAVVGFILFKERVNIQTVVGIFILIIGIILMRI